jgi:hypothetical protein
VLTRGALGTEVGVSSGTIALGCGYRGFLASIKVTVPAVATPKPSATAASNQWPFLLLLAPFVFWDAWVASDLAAILLTTGGGFLVADRANVENIVEICLFSFGSRDINLVEKGYSPIFNLFSTRHFGLSSHSLIEVEKKCKERYRTDVSRF